MVNTVAACAVAGDEDSVGIDHVHCFEAVNYLSEKIRNVIFPPHVRGLLRRAGDEPDGTGRNEIVVQVFVVVPLLFIDFERTASSSVETKDKTVAVFGFLAMNKIVKPHLEVIKLVVDNFLS